MQWLTDAIDETFQALVEKAVTQLGGDPQIAVGFEVGERISAYYGRAATVYVIAEEAFFVASVRPGPDTPTRDASDSSEMPVWQLDVKRLEWADCGRLSSRVHAEGGSRMRTYYALGDDLLQTPDHYQQEQFDQFAVEYRRHRAEALGRQ